MGANWEKQADRIVEILRYYIYKKTFESKTIKLIFF
jgi:hypothetical protein